MRVLITGSKGQLGSDLVALCKEIGFFTIETDVNNLDISNQRNVIDFFRQHTFDVVLHCAANTAVDKAEDDHERCHQINVEGTEYLVNEAKKQNAKFVYISTDYVFKGEGISAHHPEDKTDPQSYYGLTKFLGEEVVRNTTDKHFIVRTSWAFGLHGGNFIKTMIRLAREHKELIVVSNQIGSPTYTKDLAELLLEIIKCEQYGTYHATNEGYCSWAELAEYVFKRLKYSTKVIPVSSDQYPTKAKRPLNSRLNKDKLLENGFHLLPTWQDAVDRYLSELASKGEL